MRQQGSPAEQPGMLSSREAEQQVLILLLLAVVLPSHSLGGFGVVGGEPRPTPCRSLRTKPVCDITIAPFPRRTPPVKSSVSVLNKSLIQVVD